MFAGMAELVDALDLGSSERSWGFESLYPHHTGLIRTLNLSQSSGYFLVKIGLELKSNKNNNAIYLLKYYQNIYNAITKTYITTNSTRNKA